MNLAFSPVRCRCPSKTSRWLQEGPRENQEGPKRALRQPKERLRAPQERPKRRLEGLERGIANTSPSCLINTYFPRQGIARQDPRRSAER